MTPAVTTCGLSKRYGSLVALSGLDLNIPKGSIFGLLGPNGAGKSTTFGILCGWLRQTSGTANVLGVASSALHQLGGAVAALPQDARFPTQLSIRKQLAHFGRLMGAKKSEALRQADEALERVQLQNKGNQRGEELSHGMRKRVGIAQALLGKPQVLFLDEPTSGLDPVHGRKVKHLIASLAPEMTVVLSSHNLVDVQEICTHGAILNQGNLMATGTMDELTRRGAEIQIEIKQGAFVATDPLCEKFGKEHISLNEGVLRITFSQQQNPSDIIGDAMRILLDANTPILGVTRGTSLENAVIEATQNSV